MFSVTLAIQDFEYGFAAGVVLAVGCYVWRQLYKKGKQTQSERYTANEIVQLPQDILYECVKMYREWFPSIKLNVYKEAELYMYLWSIFIRSALKVLPETELLSSPFSYEDARKGVSIFWHARYACLCDQPCRDFDFRYESYYADISDLSIVPMYRDLAAWKLAQFCTLSSKHEKIYTGTTEVYNGFENGLSELQRMAFDMLKTSCRSWLEMCLMKMLTPENLMDMTIWLTSVRESKKRA